MRSFSLSGWSFVAKRVGAPLPFFDITKIFLVVVEDLGKSCGVTIGDEELSCGVVFKEFWVDEEELDVRGITANGTIVLT